MTTSPLTPEEQLKNKKAKELLCREAEKLKDSNEWRETAERIKEIQREWKEIGPVPYEDAADLNQRFRGACDIFFDNRTRHYQEQELDRIDNLYRKTELCERAEALKDAEDVQLATEEMQQLFREWKETGPVPRVKSDLIWERFKAAQDALYQRKREIHDLQDQDREGNLRIKLKLIEEAEALSHREDFDVVTPLIIDLQERWRVAGPVPREQSEIIWERFRGACDIFFKRKNIHFDQLDEARVDNLKKRERICREAVELRASVDWNSATEKIKSLQVEWKGAWPVPRDESDKLWETFREACDTFFERKRIHFEEKRKTWQKSQAVWRANMEKTIERKEEEIGRLEAAIEFEKSHIEEWQHRLDKLPAELKSIDMKMEIELKIDKAAQEIERKTALIRQLHDDITEIQHKLAKE